MGCDLLCKVSTFMEGRRWSLPRPTTLEMYESWLEILATQIGDGEYCITWTPTEDRFSLRSAWNAIQSRYPSVPWVAFVWHRGAIPRHAFCTWRSLLRGLPTNDALQRRGFSVASRCSLCMEDIETTDHIMWTCSFSRCVWAMLLPQICKQHQAKSSLMDVTTSIILQ